MAAFFELPEIPGENKIEPYKGWTALERWDLGASLPVIMGGKQGGLPNGTPNFQYLSLFKIVDKASGSFLQACCKGQTYAKATLAVCEQAQGNLHEYWKWEFEKVLITGYDPNYTGGAARFSELITMAFSKVKWTYFPLNDDGTPGSPVGPFSYNLVDNTSE